MEKREVTMEGILEIKLKQVENKVRMVSDSRSGLSAQQCLKGASVLSSGLSGAESLGLSAPASLVPANLCWLQTQSSPPATQCVCAVCLSHLLSWRLAAAESGALGGGLCSSGRTDVDFVSGPRSCCTGTFHPFLDSCAV